MMAAIAPSPGQSEALNELHQIARVTDGRIKVENARHPRQEGWPLEVDLAISCAGETGTGSSVRLEDWEPVTILIPPRFPFEHPEVTVPHRRFASLPHVLWANGICLYLADNDWDPARRMYGFVGQLLTWFEAVARGTITGQEIPWHAPLTQRRTGDHLVVGTDLPEPLENDPGLWFALALIQQVAPQLYDLRRWLGTQEANEFRDWHEQQDLPEDPDERSRVFVVPVIGLTRPADFAYPNSRAELLAALAGRGVSQQDYDGLRRYIRTFNPGLWDAAGQPPELLLLGSPAPDRYAIGSRIAHLAAWAFGADDDADTVHWMTVYDQRPRITTRRDTGRPARWLAGKRILVLGCGALGAPAAEFCVRAGAAETVVVDDGHVKPGILVRQPFTYADIGRNKAEALAARLAFVDPERPVLPLPFDATGLITGDIPLTEVDLVIDATANRSVAAALERARWTAGRPRPALLSLMVGHDCERGAATLALPGASGAGVDLLRRLAITASADPGLYDVLDDFFPDHPRGALFQPEPGCSDPTYVGSAADVAAVAGQLLNDALAVLSAAEKADGMTFPQRWATVVRAFTDGSTRPSRQRLSWADDHVRREHAAGYEIRIDLAALTSMRREVALMAQRGGPDVETGGMLLGQFDHASRVVWVTEADGPPPGSVAHAEGLRLDPTVARGWARRRRRLTRGMVAYIGAWHTHPNHPALPSTLDVRAMTEMAGDGVPVLLIILGGGPGRLTQWAAGDRPPDMHLQLHLPGAQDGPDAPVLE
jgi:integrative and conjugative element protein (TIGR02256 family)